MQAESYFKTSFLIPLLEPHGRTFCLAGSKYQKAGLPDIFHLYRPTGRACFLEAKVEPYKVSKLQDKIIEQFCRDRAVAMWIKLFPAEDYIRFGGYTYAKETYPHAGIKAGELVQWSSGCEKKHFTYDTLEQIFKG